MHGQLADVMFEIKGLLQLFISRAVHAFVGEEHMQHCLLCLFSLLSRGACGITPFPPLCRKSTEVVVHSSLYAARRCSQISHIMRFRGPKYNNSIWMLPAAQVCYGSMTILTACLLCSIVFSYYTQ